MSLDTEDLSYVVPITPEMSAVLYQTDKLQKYFQEAGKAIVTTHHTIGDRSAGFKKDYKFLFSTEQPENNYALFETMYKKIPFCQRAIDVTSDWVMQSGFRIAAPKHLLYEDKSIDDVPGLRENIAFIRKWSRWTNFVGKMGNGIKHMLMQGDGYLEVVKEVKQENDNKSLQGKDIVGILKYPKGKGWIIDELKPVPPKEMRVIREETGTVIGYVQLPSHNSYKMKQDTIIKKDKRDAFIKQLNKDATQYGFVYFAPEEMLHFKWNPLAGKAYGTGMLGALKDPIAVLLGMFEDIGIIIRNFAGPTFFFRVGTENVPATIDTLHAIKDSLLADVSSGMHIITSSMVQGEVLSPGNAAMNLEGYFQLAMSYVLLGMGVPEVLMGQGGSTTEATAKTQLEAFSRLIKTIQANSKSEVEMKLFSQLCDISTITPENIDAIPEIHWLPIESEEERRIRIENAFRFGLITREEARKELGYTPDPEGDLILDQDAEFQKDLLLLKSMGGSQDEGGDGNKKSKTARTPAGKDTSPKPTQKKKDRDKDSTNTDKARKST